MTQTPTTVTYTLEEVLGQISQKLDRIDTKFGALDAKFETLSRNVDTQFGALETKFEALRKDVYTKFEILQKDSTEMRVGQARLAEEVKGLGKRSDTQEFISRSVIVGFFLIVMAGIVKLFLPNLAS